MSATAVISRELQALRNELTLTQGELKRTQEDLTILQKAFEPYKGNQEKIEQLIWTFNLARKLYRNHPCRECQAADRAYAKEKQKSTPPPSTATTSTAATPTDLPTPPPKPSNAEDSRAALSEPRGGAVLPTQPQASATTSKGQGPMDVKMAGVRPAPTGSGSSPPATPLQKATILAGLQAMNMNLSSVSGIADVVASRSSSSSSSSSCNSSTSSSTPSTNGGADTLKPPEPSRSKKRDEPCSSSPPPPPPPLAVLHVDAGPAFHVGNTKATAPEKDRRSSNRHVPTKRKTMGGSVTTAGKGAGTRRPSDNKTGSCATNKHVEPPLFAPPGQNGPFQFGKWQGLQPDGTPQFFTFKFGTGVTIPSISISKISATTPTTTTSTLSLSGTEVPSRRSRTLPRDAFDCEALFKAVEMLQGLHSLSPAMEKPHTAAKVDADEGPSVSPVK